MLCFSSSSLLPRQDDVTNLRPVPVMPPHVATWSVTGLRVRWTAGHVVTVFVRHGLHPEPHVSELLETAHRVLPQAGAAVD